MDNGENNTEIKNILYDIDYSKEIELSETSVDVENYIDNNTDTQVYFELIFTLYSFYK